MATFRSDLLAVSPVDSEGIEVPPDGKVALPPLIATFQPYEFQYPFGGPGNEFYPVRRPTPRPHISFPVIFEAFPPEESGQHTPVRYTLDLIKSPEDPHSFRITFGSQTAYYLPPRFDQVDPIPDPTGSIRLGSFPGTLLRIADKEGSQYDTHLGVLLLLHGSGSEDPHGISTDETDPKAVLTVLKSSLDYSIFHCVFCSASGRLVYGSEQGLGIFVVDYLPSSLT